MPAAQVVYYVVSVRAAHLVDACGAAHKVEVDHGDHRPVLQVDTLQPRQLDELRERADDRRLAPRHRRGVARVRERDLEKLLPIPGEPLENGRVRVGRLRHRGVVEALRTALSADAVHELDIPVLPLVGPRLRGLLEHQRARQSSLAQLSLGRAKRAAALDVQCGLGQWVVLAGVERDQPRRAAQRPARGAPLAHQRVAPRGAVEQLLCPLVGGADGHAAPVQVGVQQRLDGGHVVRLDAQALPHHLAVDDHLGNPVDGQ
eukprot:5427131-Prymnesium_polylepis.1